jgi:hypothetical protein
VLAFLESEALGRVVTIDEMLQAESLPHQAIIEKELA